MTTHTSNEQAAPEAISSEIDPYRFFAYALSSPSRDRFDVLGRPDTWAFVRQLWQETQPAGEMPALDWYATYEDYESEYLAIFEVGMPEPPVPLFESAHYKKIPPQETALENALFYEVLGLKSDSAVGTPDYLITQLEFVSALQYLRENAASDAARSQLTKMEQDFIARHLLNWLPLAAKRLQKFQATPPFLLFIDLLERLLRSSSPSHS